MLACHAVMYIALSQTLAGIIKNFLGGFRRTFDKLPSFENVNPERLPEVQPSAELLMSCLYWMGGLGWFVIIYVGPVFAVFRAPLSRRQRVMHGGAIPVAVVAVISLGSVG